MGEMADYYAEQAWFDQEENREDDVYDFLGPSNNDGHDVTTRHRNYIHTSHGVKKMVKNNTKITHKYYVGANNLIANPTGHAKLTLKEAIDEASEKAEQTEQDQIVVQIVRVVRVKKYPIVVEKV